MAPESWAQKAPADAEPREQAAKSEPAPDIRSLLETIEDEAKRKALIEHLRALAAAQKAEAANKAAGPAVTDVIGLLTNKIQETASKVISGAEALADVPRLYDWIRDQAQNEKTRTVWLAFLVKASIVLGLGVLAELLVRWVLAKHRRALEQRAPKHWIIRFLFLSMRAVIDMVPLAAFAAVVYGLLPLINAKPMVREALLALVTAYLIIHATLILARVILVPAAPSLRILPIGSETAHYLYIWVRRLSCVIVAGYFSIAAFHALGMPTAGREGLQQFLGLFVAALVVVFVLQNRRNVAAWIRGGGQASSLPGVGQARTRLADIWHGFAIIYIAAVYAVWALAIEDGFAFLLRATVVTVLVLVLSRVLINVLQQGIHRGFSLNEDLKRRYPGLERRANRYLPVLVIIFKAVIYIVAAFALLEAWGADAFAWLETSFGQRVLQAAITIGIVLVLALLVWEMISNAIDRYLNAIDHSGAPRERSARIKTLLPLLRNILLITLGVIVVMIVLTEFGVNIAPLLAGAGIAGIAIGFGAQKLVQDLITGAFILFEDTISIGDVVVLGDKAGLVEALSIRSIRLRDLSGNVHTIPFSAVDKVTNMTKDFSYYLFEVGVAYRENTDEVTQILREIGEEMQADEEYGRLIIEPLDVLGVDKFADSAVIIKARIKTQPIKQWTVGREFNRRMKSRFDELGIEIPFPHVTLYMGEDKEGAAPPAHIRLSAEDIKTVTEKAGKKPGEQAEEEAGEKTGEKTEERNR
jgi:small conductance mechanosensitive channel